MGSSETPVVKEANGETPEDNDEAFASGLVSPPRKVEASKPTEEEQKAAQLAAELAAKKEREDKRKKEKMRKIEMMVMKYQQTLEADRIPADVVAMKCDKKRMELLEAWSAEEAAKDMQVRAR